MSSLIELRRAVADLERALPATSDPALISPRQAQYLLALARDIAREAANLKIISQKENQDE